MIDTEQQPPVDPPRQDRLLLWLAGILGAYALATVAASAALAVLGVDVPAAIPATGVAAVGALTKRLVSSGQTTGRGASPPNDIGDDHG